jgi:Tol biopolymer transport system component
VAGATIIGIVARRLATLPTCVLALSACSFDPGGLGSSGPDGPIPAADAGGGNLDASPPAPDAAPCLLGDFTAPAPLAELNTASVESAPWLSPDELEIYFHSDRSGGAGGNDLWMASRDSTSDPFSSPVNLPGVNTEFSERHPALSADGLSLYFISSRPGSAGGFDIWVATRGDPAGTFSGATRVAAVSSTGDEWFPSIAPDDRTLLFSSSRSGRFDVYVASRADPTADFGAPVAVASVNSASDEGAATPSKDGLELFVQSNRPGGPGHWNIWRAARAEPGQAFGTASLVPELNDGSSTQGRWLSPDGRRIYLSSNRTGSFNLFVATRDCEP